MEERNEHWISVRKPNEQRPIRIPKGKCGTEKNFNDEEWESVEGIHVVQGSGFLVVQFLFI